MQTFLVAPIGIHSIILGMPWLEYTNPTIDWRLNDQSTGGVRFIHPSVQRWFKGEPQNQKLLTHDYLAKTCLTYLNFDVFDAFDVPIDYSMSAIIEAMSYPFLRYAARFWGDHAREAPEFNAANRCREWE